MKYWIKPNIENRIKNGEIPAYFQLRPSRDRRDSCASRLPRARSELKNDFVFAMTGYRPDLEFLEAHGITLQPESGVPTRIPRRSKATARECIWRECMVAGMHTNEIFIENGRFHGGKIAEAIAGSLQ